MYDSHKDNLARAEEEAELFGEAFEDADLEAELAGLVEMDAVAELGNLGPQAHIPNAVPTAAQQVPA